MESYEGNETFLAGCAIAVGTELDKRLAARQPQKSFAIAAMELIGEKEGVKRGMPKFDVSKHPAVVMNILCSVVTFVGDPDLV